MPVRIIQSELIVTGFSRKCDCCTMSGLFGANPTAGGCIYDYNLSELSNDVL